jgi:tRNA(fMet)-specific endonuclease VapC
MRPKSPPGLTIIAGLERNGTPIGAYDLQIAGHARSQGLIVVTGNLGEFRRVDGLRRKTGSPSRIDVRFM